MQSLKAIRACPTGLADWAKRKTAKMSLDKAWIKRAELRAKAVYIAAMGYEMQITADKSTKPYDTVVEGKMLVKALKLRSQINLLKSDGSILRAKGQKLVDKANIVWANAVYAARGNIRVQWEWNNNALEYDCILDTGEVFIAIKRGD